MSAGVKEPLPALPDPQPQRLAGLFAELARLVTPSRKERPVADLVLSFLRSLGLAPWEDDAATMVNGVAGNVLCSVPGQGNAGGEDGIPRLALGAHMDTVACSGDIHPVLEDGVFRSSAGTILGADDKAAVAVLLHASELLLGAGLTVPPYELFFTVAEEVGLRGAKAMKPGVFRSRRALVLDASGPVGGVIVRAPGQNTISALFTGRAAHAGVEPEKGINAIAAAARAVADMPLGRLDDETTANIGLISGGSARNIVPESCRVEGEVRSHSEERLADVTQQVIEALNWGAAVGGTDIEIDVSEEYRAYALSRECSVVKLGRQALQAASLVPRIESAGGGSDASILNGWGVETANMAIGMEAVHTAEEHVSLKDMVALTRVVMAAILLSADEAPSKESSREGS